MGTIIQLSGDIHQQVQVLLPWFINDTLEEAEAAAVEAHLAECAECRRDLVQDSALSKEAALASMDIDQAWAAMRDRIASPAQRADLPGARPTNVVALRRKPILKRPIALGWAMAAQAAALLLVVGGMRLGQPATEPVYHALGAAPVPAVGNVIVIFRPEATEQAFRAALAGSHASLVGGPTDSAAYILHVDATQRAGALARLRANGEVVLAEPIDGPGRP